MKITSILTVFFITFSIWNSNAQIKERERPPEWKQLISGGKFIDRFLPIPVIGALRNDVWGGQNVLPRYVDNGIEDEVNSYWGGNAVKTDDGTYHLFVCGWPENSPKGHMYWINSTVFHAVSDHSFGPYKIKDVVGPGHNPEIYQMEDGRYVVYVIDGYYLSENINGPWTYGKFDFDRRDRKIIEGLSNLSFAKREDGTYLMVCRGGGIWFSKDGLSTWHQVTDKSVYPPVEGEFEDPVVWRTDVQYHMIVNDWLGRIAFSLRSKDGVKWKVDPGEAYAPGISNYTDGTKEEWFKYERIKVLQDEYGRATQAHFAVIDTIKWNDLENDHHSSKNIVIPLTKGRLMTVLNKKPITEKTQWIELKVKAENDFDPHTDIDLASLRFGAAEEVNFGRGSKVFDTKKDGKDMIIRFYGEGNGLTKENFAAKLIGKNKEGSMLYGYTRIPGVEYIQPILSPKLPNVNYDGESCFLEVEVQNFGQAASKKTRIEVWRIVAQEKHLLVSGHVGKLQPFGKEMLSLKCDEKLSNDDSHQLKVILYPPDQDPVSLQGKIMIQDD